ncbi:MAG: hypothetical protein KDD40_09380, partial [Bdellovibrionales bacterium]|nr:hypothetical protein [Bdellovibrionales bacterium]
MGSILKNNLMAVCLFIVPLFSVAGIKKNQQEFVQSYIMPTIEKSWQILANSTPLLIKSYEFKRTDGTNVSRKMYAVTQDVLFPLLNLLYSDWPNDGRTLNASTQERNLARQQHILKDGLQRVAEFEYNKKLLQDKFLRPVNRFFWPEALQVYGSEISPLKAANTTKVTTPKFIAIESYTFEKTIIPQILSVTGHFGRSIAILNLAMAQTKEALPLLKLNHQFEASPLARMFLEFAITFLGDSMFVEKHLQALAQSTEEILINYPNRTLRLPIRHPVLQDTLFYSLRNLPINYKTIALLSLAHVHLTSEQREIVKNYILQELDKLLDKETTVSVFGENYKIRQPNLREFSGL